MGIPSFAISLAADNNFVFKPAADFAYRLARLVIEKGLPARVLLNVNIPDTKGEEITLYKITSQGKNAYRNTIEEKSDPRGLKYYWIGRKDEELEAGEGDEDFNVIKQRLISITPLQVDRTHYSAIRQLLHWEL